MATKLHIVYAHWVNEDDHTHGRFAVAVSASYAWAKVLAGRIEAAGEQCEGLEIIGPDIPPITNDECISY